MNEAKAALTLKFPYAKKLAILEKYSSNKSILASYSKRLNSPQIRKKIDYELRLLKFSPKVDKYKAKEQEAIKEALRMAGVKTEAKPSIERKLPIQEEGEFYPPGVKAAIQERSKLWNLREKLGRELVAFADNWSKQRRAANVAEQKRLHKIILSYSHFINKWKDSGQEDFSILEGAKEMDPEVREPLLIRWQRLSRKASKARTNSKAARERKDSPKETYWNLIEEETVAEQNRIGALIGKTRRNEYRKRNHNSPGREEVRQIA